MARTALLSLDSEWSQRPIQKSTCGIKRYPGKVHEETKEEETSLCLLGDGEQLQRMMLLR